MSICLPLTPIIDLILVHDALTVHQLTEDLQLAHFNLSPGKHIVTFIEVCLHVL